MSHHNCVMLIKEDNNTCPNSDSLVAMKQTLKQQIVYKKLIYDKIVCSHKVVIFEEVVQSIIKIKIKNRSKIEKWQTT